MQPGLLTSLHLIHCKKKREHVVKCAAPRHVSLAASRTLSRCGSMESLVRKAANGDNSLERQQLVN